MENYPHKRLSTMMIFQYAIEGVWLPIAARYLSAPLAEGGLGFTGTEVGLILGLGGSIGAFCGPFIAGQIADRHFPVQRVIACLVFIGGLVRWWLSYQTTLLPWIIGCIIYGILYKPTMALSTSLTFSHVKDRKRQFPLVRVWGTFGWLIGCWIFPMTWLQTGMHLQWMPPFLVGTELSNVTALLGDALRFSGTISISYALYCLTLPDTPPQKAVLHRLAWGRAFGLLRDRSFLVLFLASLPASIVESVYYMQDSPYLSAIGLRDSDIMPAGSVSQVGEILVMTCLGFFISRFGFRKVIFLGLFANFARCAVFSCVGLPASVIVSAHLLHGFCYACFFAAGNIYVDRLAPKDARHSAQTVFALLSSGLAPLLSGFLSGSLDSWFSHYGPVHKFVGIWSTMGVVALVSSVLFVFYFRPPREHTEEV